MTDFKDMTSEDVFVIIQTRIQNNISKNIANIQSVGVDPTGAVNFLFNASLLIDIVCETFLELSREQNK